MNQTSRGLDIHRECRFTDFRSNLPQVLRHRARRAAEQGLHPQGLGRLHPQAQDGAAEEEDPRGEDEAAGGHEQETVAQNPGTFEVCVAIQLQLWMMYGSIFHITSSLSGVRFKIFVKFQ